MGTETYRHVHSLRFRGRKPSEVTWGRGLAFRDQNEFEIHQVIWERPGWSLRVLSIGGVLTCLTWHPYLTIGGARIDLPHLGCGFRSLETAIDHATSAFESVRRALAKERG
jgi:hypothetical protein